ILHPSSNLTSDLCPQLNDLRGTLEDTIVSLSSQLSSSLQQEVEKKTEEAFSSSVEVGRKLSLLFQNYEQLEDTVNLLGRGRTFMDSLCLCLGQSLDLVYDVQRAIQELQAECERLQEATRSLHEDNQQKQGHIEELYKTAEELQVKKADKLMVESEIKADKLALDSKVSRLQFDAATEQLTSMFHELLNKMTGQEHDWHQLVDKLSTDMECKLNRMELDSVKLQLEERWRSILKKLQTQSAPLEDDAAGIRKKLLERFQCLSCDRVIMKQTPGPIVQTLPMFPPFPAPKSARPWTMDQIRQHYRTKVSYKQKVTDLPSLPPEQPLTSGFQEADIIGRDGRIYKGRFNIGQLKSTETKLPNIVSRDGGFY
uniref:DUF4795 domain-containing protein n=1 Tax=Xiphophorus maculatus TaxID=8083 RepID=A0A3B5QKI2_XIPMA